MIYRLISACLIALPITAAKADSPSPFAAFDAASEQFLSNPHDLILGPDGLLYVSDVGNDRIAVVDPGTLSLVREIGALELSAPHDVDFDSEGRLLVADTGNDRIAIFVGDTLVGELRGGITRVEGVAVHPNGRIYATGAWSGTLIAFENGRPVAGITSGLSAPHDVAVDAQGNIWVADASNDRMVRFSPELEQQTVLDAPSYGWAGPRYMDFDASGNLVVADKYSHRIKMISPDGRLVGVIGTEAGLGPNQFRTPEGVEIVGDVLYFSDSGNDRVVRYRVVTH